MALIPFSGTLTEGKVYTDNQGRYFKYQNGSWYSISSTQYNAGSQKGIIAPQEGNWMLAQSNYKGTLQETTQQQQQQQQIYSYNGQTYYSKSEAENAVYSDMVNKATQNDWSYFYTDVGDGSGRKYYYMNPDGGWNQASSESDAKTQGATGYGENWLNKNAEKSKIYTVNDANGNKIYHAYVNGKWTKANSETEAKKMLSDSNTTKNISFISGLTQAQKDSITNLVNSRPSTDWSETDIKNWNYATNKSSFPSGQPKSLSTTQQQTQQQQPIQQQTTQQQQPAQSQTTQQQSTSQQQIQSQTQPTYSAEFENYWKNITPTFEKSEANKKAMWEQWNTMGPPADYKPATNEPLPTGTGPLPMAEGEKEALIKKYVDAGYSQAQAESKVGEITSTRAPYKTGNSIIDAIVEQVTGQQLTDAGFKWNEKLQAEAKTMAEKDFGPYYTRMYETEEAQLKSGLQQYEKTYERNVEDTGLAKEKIQREYTDALQSARRQYASSGLTYSSERSKKEGELGSSLTRGLTAEDTALDRSKEDIQAAEQEALAKGELRLGTSVISPLTSKYGYKSPLSESYSGELELEKRTAISEDVQRQ